MDSFFLRTTVAAAICFITLLGTLLLMVKKKFRIHQENKDQEDSSSSSPSSAFSSSSPNLPCSWTHHVFPSFRGEDVRRNFLSHIQKEFLRKGITPFIDNEIRRGESIGPELIRAIRGSKIAIVLLSRNYASSKWCLDELVEIMKCKKDLGQTVFAIFYEVDPSHVKKLTGEFGAVFEKTCKGKTKEDIGRWRQAFSEVATIAGYDSRNWENESVMIEEIVSEISKRLINSTPSSGFEGLIGMEVHMEKIKQLLCFGSDERRTIGIWGPSGIGKTTIARVLHNQISDSFQLSVFMKFKPSDARPTYSDDHDVKLQLEQQFLSQILNQEDVKIPHLGAAQNLLMDKKVFVVLDGVDQLVQLQAMPKAQCLGRGTRIIITTQDQKVLKASEIKHVYNVKFPPHDEAYQILCMNAFGQKSPYVGFENLAWEVTNLAGSLPLGLRVMGSHLRGMSKQEWKAELPRLRIRLNGEIGSILKFSYDALDEEDKDLFLHIACVFNNEGINSILEGALENRFTDVRQGLRVLLQKSFISDEKFRPIMHNLLVDLGREIVRNQSICEPGKRQFLVNAKDIFEVLTHDRGSKSVIGINLNLFQIEGKLNISARAFEKMYNLQYLRVSGHNEVWKERLHLPQGLIYLPELRILDWVGYPMTCLPLKFNPKLLVRICMTYSKLEKLWDGVQPLMNLKFMDLSHSSNLEEIPDLSTATNLLKLYLFSCTSLVELHSSVWNLSNLQLEVYRCSSLVELPSFIWNAKNFKMLNLRECSSLMKLPSSIGNATSLQEINLQGCSRLIELPSSIGNIINLQKLILSECYSLIELPSSIIGKCINLQELDLSGCSRLIKIPYSIGNIIKLKFLDLTECYRLVELPLSIGNLITLEVFILVGCSRLVELPSSVGNLINLRVLRLIRCSNIVELPSSIGGLNSIRELHLANCSSLVELPYSIGKLTNLQELYLDDCSNLVELPSSIGNNINIKRLHLKRCSALVELPCSIGNLTKLIDFDLNHCSSLVELPSSIGNIITLQNLYLSGCINLVELPSFIGNIINLQNLELNGCSSLVELPSSIGNAINLQKLELNGCLSLVKIPSSIGNLCMLTKLSLQGCAKLEFLPVNIKLDSLKELDLTGCSQLKCFPEGSTNIERLMLCGTLIKEVPISIKSWSRLHDLHITYCKELEEFSHALDIITELDVNNTDIEDVSPWINGISRLRRLVLRKCRKLVSLPARIGSQSSLDQKTKESMERIVCSFPNPQICLISANIWSLLSEQDTGSRYAILPGRKVPAYFTYRAVTGGSLRLRFDQRRFPTWLRFKACILLVYKGNKGGGYNDNQTRLSFSITEHFNGRIAKMPCMLSLRTLHPVLSEHLYIFENYTSYVEFNELLFKFEVISNNWEIGECGIREILEEDPHTFITV